MLLACGRSHYYEGTSILDTTYPVRILKELGVEHIILTNAAGAINIDFAPGDLMIMKDHINFMGNNPLIGFPTEDNNFVDLTECYDRKSIKKVINLANDLNVTAYKGVYAAVAGPSYEVLNLNCYLF